MTKVAVPGLEPRLREPESRVLPLHHTAKKRELPHRDSNRKLHRIDYQSVICSSTALLSSFG